LARHESLLPREHGAYAELLFPLLTALLLGWPTLASACFAIATVAFFLLHEPVAVLSGTRGARVRTQMGARTRRRAAWLAALGGASGATGFLLAAPAARLAVALPLGFSLALIPALREGRLKTLASETLVIATLSSTVLPIAIASGSDPVMAATASLVWFLTFSLGTIAVHAIKARHKESFGSRWTIVATPIMGAITVGAGLFAASVYPVPTRAALTLVPAGAVALMVGLVHIHPRKLKTVGWTLVASNVIVLLLLITA
jgi:hypothetical protein